MTEDTIDTEGVCSVATINSYQNNVTDYVSLQKLYNKSIVDEIYKHETNQIMMYENFSDTLSLRFYQDFITWLIIGTLITSLFNMVAVFIIFRFVYISNTLLGNQVIGDIKNNVSKVFPESPTETKSTGNMKDSTIASTTITTTISSKSFNSTTSSSMKGVSNTGNLKVGADSNSIAPHLVEDVNNLDGNVKESRGKLYINTIIDLIL